MPPADEAAVLRGELAALRRQVHGLFALLLLVLGSVAVVLLRSRGTNVGDFGPNEVLRVGQVETHGVTLLDADNAIRGMVHCPPAGPSLALMDSMGRMAVSIATDPPGLSLADAGSVRVRAAAGPDSAALLLAGRNGEPVVSLGLGAAGGSIRVTDGTGKVLFEQPIGTNPVR
jgi:hypothetical protein